MEYVIVFSNTHSAISAEQVLKKVMTVKIMPISAQLGDICGIGLRIDESDLPATLKLVRKNQIKTKAFYKIQTINGEKRYEKCNY